jgi:hypothetical protein
MHFVAKHMVRIKAVPSAGNLLAKSVFCIVLQLYLVCIHMSILWWFIISPLLKLLGQDPVLSEMAEQ